MNIDTWQRIIDIITLLGPWLAAIPGLLALRAINKKTVSEAKKLEAESESAEAIAADTITNTVLKILKEREVDTQKYRKMSEDYECTVKELRDGFTGCKDQLTRLSGEMTRVLDENAKLIKSNTELTDKIRLLEATIRTLASQLKDLGIEPLFGKRAEDSDLVKEGEKNHAKSN